MKKILTFDQRSEVSSGSSTDNWRSSTGDGATGDLTQNKDLGKMHKAATVGDAAKVEEMLLLQIHGVDDRDKMSRTALHLACANGHPEVVTLLVGRKCLLNLCDNENKTALVKAVQCQQEECAAILLDHGADPNVMDIDGNTALHYAVLGQNIAMVEKLISCMANIEVKNKDDLTPLSLAKSENKEQMVELFLSRSANMHAVDQMDRYYSAFDSIVMNCYDFVRSSKEISHEECEVKEKMNSTDDLDCLTQSSEAISELGLSSYSNYENFMLLIKQLCKDCKDSDNLYKIQNAVLSYERSIELGKNQCELLTEKVKTMENRISGLYKKLSETRAIKSQLEHQKVELEGKLCSLRFTLKEEKEKRQKADELYEKYREQLMKKEEQYIKENEMNRELETTLRTLEMELQIVRKNLSQVVGERNDILRQLSQEQNARKLQDENLAELLGKQKELERTYEELNSENDDLMAKLKTASSKCVCLDGKNKLLQQELLSMKAIEKKCEKLENKKQKLKQELVNLKRHMEMNMVELSEVLLYKQKIEERARRDVEDKLEQVNQILQTQIASKELSEQLIEYRNASIRSHLELRNKDLESQLSKVQNFLNDSRSELEKYERLYLEELKGRKSLENELVETQKRLTEVRTELLLQKGENRFWHNTRNMMPVLETPRAGDLNSLVPNRSSAPRENLELPTSRPCTSAYVMKMWQEFEEMLKRELKEDAAEFESESYRACPLGAIDQSNSC